MERSMLKQLREWRRSPVRRPLVLQGARQTGKTWILQEFGKRDFRRTLYVNFETHEAAASIFEQDYNPRRIMDMLGLLEFGQKVQPEETLVIFDEIQEKPRVLTSLKYFAELAPEYAVCAAGSFLGIAMHAGASFPVGKVDLLQLEPLSFEEFLLADGKGDLVEALRGMDPLSLLPPFEHRLNDSLLLYMAVGGMPAAVNAWFATRDFAAVRKEQGLLLQSYEEDFSKHVPPAFLAPLRQLWRSIPAQLARENNKFVYSAVKEGGRGREFRSALDWLEDTGMIRRVFRVNKAAEPLGAFAEAGSFKVYHLDIGLLACMAGVRPGVVLEGDRVYSEFFGAFAEQFVLQELRAYMPGKPVYYWASGNVAEVEFVFCSDIGIVPVDVKGGRNLRAKSLSVFRGKYAPPASVIVGKMPLAVDHGVLKMPFCYLWRLADALAATRTAAC